MGKLDARAYANLFKDQMKVRTCAGGFVARFYTQMFTLGTLSMYSQAGYSYALAGIGVGIVQLSNFLIAPQVGKLIDRHGQGRVVPVATLVSLVGLAGMLLTVHFHGPFLLAFLLSILIGFTPQLQSTMRARWSYLNHRRPDPKDGWLMTAYSFEGILDDTSFMFAPSLAIAISAWLFPEAGMLVGGICYVVGIALLLFDKRSEPDVAYMQQLGQASITDEQGKHSNVFLMYPVILVFFVSMLLFGLLYGFVDQGAYALCREQANEGVASLVFIFLGVSSALSGFVYGMLKVKARPVVQVLRMGIVVGVLFLPCFFVTNIPMLFVSQVVGAVSFAPFIITLNSMVERTVASSRVTESLTWMNAGMQLGLAAGPTIAGFMIDATSSHSAFIGTGTSALLIPIIFFAALPLLRKALGDR